MKTIKAILLALSVTLLSFSVNPALRNSLQPEKNRDILSWKNEAVDLGNISQGKPVDINFEFENTSKTPVLITDVKASCGCTATEYTKEIIAPSKTGMIKAIFNAASKGAFTKTVTVTTNANESPKVLTIRGIVI